MCLQQNEGEAGCMTQFLKGKDENDNDFYGSYRLSVDQTSFW